MAQIDNSMTDADAVALIERWCPDAGHLAPATVDGARYLRPRV